MTEQQQGLGKGPEKKRPGRRGKKNEVYATTFVLTEEGAMIAARILDTLNAPEPMKVDPEIIETEAEELWGPDPE